METPIDSELSRLLDEVAESVRNQQCILFLGAGVHYGPPAGSPYVYSREKRPLLGKSLAQHLASDCTLLKDYPDEKDSLSNLARISQFYEKLKSRRELIAELQEKLDNSSEPSPALCALAELDFPLILTTNYDSLFERALRRANKRPAISAYRKDGDAGRTPEPMNFSVNRPFLFKMHGSFDDQESIVITDEDYIQFVLRMSDRDSPVPETFQYHFKRWPTLFVGYRLMDYNLRLLFMTLRWKVDPARRPETYSLDPKPDPLILQVWETEKRYVKFITQDVWSFVPTLYEKIKGKPMSS